MFSFLKRAAVLAAAVVWGASVAGAVQAEPVPLEAYSASPAIEYIELSPDGEMIARITVVGEERAVVVTRLETSQHTFAAAIGEAKVRDLRWIDDKRLLITSSQTRSIASLGVPKSEVYFGLILNLETRKFTKVLDRTDDVLNVLYGPAVVRREAQDHTLFVRAVSVNESAANLYRIDLDSGRGRSIASMGYDDEDFVLDGEGEVIAVARYMERRKRWMLMLPGDGLRQYREAWAVDAPLDPPALLGMGRTPRTVIVSASRPDMAKADADAETTDVLFEVNVDTGEWTRLPFEHEPDYLMHHPLSRLLIGGVRTEADGAHYEFLEPTADRRWRMIERAYTGRRPRLTSWSDDLKQIVVFTDQTGSGLYEIVDFNRGVAEVLAAAYPDIPADQVGVQRAIQYAAADGMEIPGYLTLPPGVDQPRNLPLVVLAHGGPASHDTAGFDWWAQALASRGYAVLQANFRGSTGQGLAFMEAGYGEWGRKMQTDLSDGVRWLAAEGVVDPARVCIVGASYGGYAAMAGMTLDREVYRCGVAVSGVSDLRRMVNWEARQDGRRDNRTVRYWNRFMGAARLNDRALDALSPAFLAAAADKPLLLIHGLDDTVVPIEQSRVMAEAMRRADKPVELIELAGEDHWLSRADTRQQMLRETVRFLEANNPAR